MDYAKVVPLVGATAAAVTDAAMKEFRDYLAKEKFTYQKN